MNNILVIDDEPDILKLLSITLSRMGLGYTCAGNLKEAYQALSDHEFQLCLTDLKLPDGSGLTLVETMQNQYPHIPVIVITAHGSMDVAIKAMKYGAFDFINKPIDLQHVRQLIHNALSVTEPALLAAAATDMPEIIGESAKVQQVKEQIRKVSRSQAPVLITGESGSGKELVARSIHTYSSRKNAAFIAVNCGAIPHDLMESEFFGHTKGSFTGAHQDQQGLFHAAHGGTLLLDEIADLPLAMQVKLLRVIQEKKIRPVGSSAEVSSDVRILSATHKNLTAAVANGTFRSDLFYRINVIEMTVPPLRERTDDIRLLSDSILAGIAQRNATSPHTLSVDAIHALQHYDFPGNIRELENILERACALTETPLINVDNLFLPCSVTVAPIQHEVTVSDTEGSSTLPVSGIAYNPEHQSIDDYLNGIEKDILLHTLAKYRWNRTHAAKVLGITFRSLRYRLKKLAINIDTGD